MNQNSNRLAVLFSAPLAVRSVNDAGESELQEIPFLDFDRERALLMRSLKEGCNEVGREIQVRVEAATADSLRTVVTLGCHAIHFTGKTRPAWLPLPAAS